jgi:ubiquinone/menaquinone biosynthesis C-methylase UbiE
MTDQHSAFIGSIATNYDRYLGPCLFDPYAADLVSRLTVPKGASVLELACGTGIVTRRLRDRLSPASKLVATDLNPAMMEHAAQKFRPDENIDWKQADIASLPFPDKSFDAVVCQFGFMFVPDKDKAFREAYRVLKPDGFFVFNVWDAMEFNDLAYLAHTTISTFFDDDPPSFYVTPFSFHEPEKILTFLKTAGFKEIDLSLLKLNSVSSLASDVAKGLVEGNPVIIEIKERSSAEIAEVKTAVAKAIATRCGDDPVQGEMQAFVCTCVR